MARLIAWEAANLFVGDNTSEDSKHLILNSVSLPSFKEKTQDHHAGGAIGAINVGGLGFEALEISFKLTGSDTQTRAQFGLGGAQPQRYTVYGAMRDKQTGRQIERRVVAFGYLQEMTHGEFSRGNLGEQDHKIGEITHYEEYEDGKQIYLFDLYQSQWVVNGVDQYATTRGILRI